MAEAILTFFGRIKQSYRDAQAMVDAPKRRAEEMAARQLATDIHNVAVGAPHDRSTIESRHRLVTRLRQHAVEANDAVSAATVISEAYQLVRSNGSNRHTRRIAKDEAAQVVAKLPDGDDKTALLERIAMLEQATSERAKGQRNQQVRAESYRRGRTHGTKDAQAAQEQAPEPSLHERVAAARKTHDEVEGLYQQLNPTDNAAHNGHNADRRTFRGTRIITRP